MDPAQKDFFSLEIASPPGGAGSCHHFILRSYDEVTATVNDFLHGGLRWENLYLLLCYGTALTLQMYHQGERLLTVQLDPFIRIRSRSFEPFTLAQFRIHSDELRACFTNAFTGKQVYLDKVDELMPLLMDEEKRKQDEIGWEPEFLASQVPLRPEKGEPLGDRETVLVYSQFLSDWLTLSPGHHQLD